MDTKSKKLDPATRVAPATYRATLKIVNKLLTKLGKPVLKALPKGEPGMSNACPLVSAFKPLGVDTVDGGEELSGHLLYPGSKDVYVDIDLSVYLTSREQDILTQFIDEFDRSDDAVTHVCNNHRTDSWSRRMREVAKVRGLPYVMNK